MCAWHRPYYERSSHEHEREQQLEGGFEHVVVGRPERDAFPNLQPELGASSLASLALPLALCILLALSVLAPSSF